MSFTSLTGIVSIRTFFFLPRIWTKIGRRGPAGSTSNSRRMHPKHDGAERALVEAAIVGNARSRVRQLEHVPGKIFGTTALAGRSD